MKVTKEKIENSQAFLTVEMEPAEMEEPLEAAYRRLVQKARIPGFRKGKAPRPILERHLGRESLLEEAIKHLVPQAYEEALKEQAIVPFAQPDIEVTQPSPLIFKAIVPLQPAAELGDYHSIRMAPDPVEITEDNINAVIEELRHQHATWEPVARPSDYHDLVTVDISSEVGEKPLIKKLGAPYQLLRDSVAPAPGFAAQLAGMKKGEEKEFKLNLPENYVQSEFAGKEAFFKIKMQEIKEEKLPELNDELAKQISPEFPTVSALREEVARSLRQSAEGRGRIDFEERVIKAVVEQSKIDYPPVLVEMEINRLLNDSNRQFQMSGRSLEAYLHSVNKTPEQLREEFRPVAVKNVASSLVLGKITEVEKIEVGDPEIDAELDSMTSRADAAKKDELRKMLDNPKTRESIKRSLVMRKTIERLMEIAKSPETTGEEVKEAKK